MDSSVTAPTARVQTPEADEIEAPTPVQQSRPLSFSNGVLKRHLQPPHVHLNVPPVVVTYKECLKNHAASLGGHALDGCGEFMPSPTSNLADPTSLRCAACSCHRNFHRREPEEPPVPLFPNATQHLIEYQPHHRHHPPPPPPPQQQRGGHSSPNSSSPPPISSSYFPSAPHMLLALSNGLAAGPPPETNYPSAGTSAATGRKRFRTRFSVDQKDRMLEFADRVGWKMQKRDEELIADFCGKIGVDRSVFKVWMHNKKSILGKRGVTKINGSANGIRRSISLDNSAGADQYHHEDNKEDSQQQDLNDHHHHHDQYHNNGRSGSTAQVVATNGSSSSSL